MNRQHWKELLPIITAFANGGKLEFRGSEGWVEMTEATFRTTAKDYRIAPRTIRIGAFDAPEPYRGEMERGWTYYSPELLRTQFYEDYTWDADEHDARYMQRGLVHLTPEAAALHGKALASLTAGEGVEL